MSSRMQQAIRAAVIVPMSAFLLAVSQAQTAAPMAPDSMPMGNMQHGTAGSGDMKKSGDTDKDFAMMMKMHHQGAIDMAQMELAHGKSPAMKTMAKSIIAAQKKEIAQFDRWLATQR
jgi:uncharacterized protein (DUF305 family)